MTTRKIRVFSGIQPTGDIHIGNYLAAIRNWVQSQDESHNIFCIVDLHAITIQQDPEILKSKTREVAALLIASGIDPEKSDLFVQSHIPAHSELAWILNCVIPMGWMQRMTQFKEKSDKRREHVSVGLFDYPALMAADILLYDSDAVPVGDDQKQHVELARDCAQRFNSIYGATLVVPEPIIPRVGARIMGLDDPTKKMSKSEGRKFHAVGVLDDPDVIRNIIKRATTDSGREITFNEKRPAIYNLLCIYELFSGQSRSVIEQHFSGKGYADLKRELAEVIIEGLRPVQERYREITADPGYMADILKSGAEKVKPIAEKTIKRVHSKIGIG